MKYETELNLDFNNTMSIMINEIEDDSCILEFGPASGRLTKYLNENKNCDMFIVELDAEAAAIAAQYAKQTIVGDIEQYEWFTAFKNIQFDYILFADVLEHLYHPQQVIDKCKQLLKPNGYIIVSLPNIAHNSIIIDLLNNHFRYQPTGLLDNTHIRFWTMENIDNMFKDLKLYIELKTATYTQVGYNEIVNSYADLGIISASALKTRELGEVYQYVYKVTPNPNAANINNIRLYSDYYYIQWFLDDGEGFVDNNKVKETLNWNSFNKHFCIKLNESTTKLRLDPINTSCTICIQNLIARNSTGESFNIQPESTNAASFFNDTYIFLESQPIIVFETLNISQIEFDIIYLEIEPRSENITIINEELQQRRITIEQKENYINELRELITKKENCINDYKKQADILEEKNTQLSKQLETAKEFLSKPAIKQLFYCFLKTKQNQTEDKQ